MENGKKKTECMKIVIDGRMWNESGIGRYLRNLISELQKLDKKNDYYTLFLEKDFKDKEILKQAGNFHKVLADFKWYTLEEQIKLPRMLNKLKPDLVHFPHFNVPIFYPGKFVVTIHDLIHEHYKMSRATLHDPIMYKIKHLGYKKVFEVAVNNSVKILTPSEFVKNQLINEWRVNDEKILVTPEAVEDKLFSIGNKMSSEKITSVLKKFKITQPYIFYVGNAYPHKNVEGLIKAFKMVKDSGVAGAPQNDKKRLQLVLSGSDHYFWKKLKSSVFSLQSSDIVYTGFVSDSELVALYKNAKCFVMPSFEEGFGIPILEAMAVGTPVVSSSAASLPEVGGDAALYFNPQDIEDMIDKISKILNNEKLRLDL